MRSKKRLLKASALATIAAILALPLHAQRPFPIENGKLINQLDGNSQSISNAGALTATTGNFSGNLVADTNTFFVNSATNRVGVGTTSPTAPLDVLGTVKAGTYTSNLSAADIDGAGETADVSIYSGSAASSDPGIFFKCEASSNGTYSDSQSFYIGAQYSTSYAGGVPKFVLGYNSPGYGYAYDFIGVNFLTYTTAGGLILEDSTILGVGNITGNLIVDTTTLFVDSTNNRVGVGTASPSAPLTVVGSGNITANLTVDGTTLFADAANNRVGVGTNAPSTTLTVNGTTTTTALTMGTGNITDSDGDVVVGDGLTVTGNTTIDTNTLFVDSVNNRVGVGTATPAHRLDVSGNSNFSTASGDFSTSATFNPSQMAFTASDSDAGITSYLTISADSVAITNDSRNININNWLYAYNGVSIGQSETGTKMQAIYSASASIDFASTSAQTTNSGNTITVTGASATNTPSVQIGLSGALPTGCSVHGIVTSSNTVTLYFVNASASAQDPAAITIRATVTQF